MRKIFEYIGLITLMCFSFFVTEKTSMIAKNIDEIMINIKEKYKQYETESENAIIDGNTIIPGKCSRKVNIDKSYNEMKKLGMYDDKLYQYEYSYPNISLTNNYDKLIIAGNNKKEKIYIFIELDYFNKKIINNYDFKNYNFIVNYEFYQENVSLIRKLIKNDNSIILNSTSFKNYKKISNDYLDRTSKKIYCYNENNDDYLKICASNKSSSIGNIKEISDNYLLYAKKELVRGKFFKFSLNENLINNIQFVESYIESKGLTISNIDSELQEC